MGKRLSLKTILLGIVILAALIVPFSMAYMISNQFDLVGPTNNSWTKTTQPVFSFRANSTNSSTLSCELWVNIASTYVSYGTNTSVPNGTLSYITASSALPQGSHRWYVNCTDNVTNTTAATSYILFSDYSAPNVTAQFPTTLTIQGSRTINFSWTVRDHIDNTLNCSIYINGIKNVTEATTTTNNTRGNDSITLTTDGTFTWYVNCSDNASNYNVSATRTITVDTADPVITFNMPKAGNMYRSSFKVNVSVTETSFSKNAKYKIINNNTGDLVHGWRTMGNVSLNIWNATINLTNQSFNNGNYTIWVNVTDYIGNGTNSSRYFVVDRNKSSVILNMPADLNISASRTINFSWTARDNYSTHMLCNISLKRNGTASTISSSSLTGISSPRNTLTNITYAVPYDGFFTWWVNCTDNASNVNGSSKRLLTVNSRGPVIKFNRPSGNNTYYKANFVLNVSAWDNTTIKNISYRIMNATDLNTNLTSWIVLTNYTGVIWNATVNLSNRTRFPDQNYTIIINATDSLDKTSNVSRMTFWLDKTNPTIGSFSCDKSAAYVGDTVTCYCMTLSDNFATSQNLESSKVNLGVDTTSSGTKTATCTITDRAGNTASSTYTVTVTYRSSGGSSGGGGGGGSSVVNTGKKSWYEIKEGESKEYDISDSEIPVTKIGFQVKETVRDASLQVQSLTTLPESVVSFSGKSYQKMKIISTNLEGSEVSSGFEIEFRVSKAWLKENGVNKNNIALFREVDGKWTELKTTFVKEDSIYVYFKANSPGFSYFVIGEKTVVAAEPAATSTPPATPEITAQETAAETQPSSEEQAEAQAEPESSGDEVAKVNRKSVMIILLIVLIAAIGVGSYFLYQKQK